MVEMWRCAQCGQEKPRTAAFWTSKGGTRKYVSPCTECHRKNMQDRRTAALEQDPEAFRTAKAEEMRAYRAAKKEAARLVQLAKFADTYDRLRADGMTNETALREAARLVPEAR